MTVHNCKYCKTECGFGGEDRQRDCKGYTPMTNADLIRSMTDEELAKVFVQHEYTVANAILGGFGLSFPGDEAYFKAAVKEFLKRLQQPVEE